MSLLPHHKLDWNLGRLEKHLDDHQADAAARLELAGACLSRAAFHAGGDEWFDRALQHARRLLQDEPGSAAGQAIAAACLVGLDRLDAALEHADRALELDPELALAHYVRALWQQAARRADPGVELHLAVREAESACRLTPEAWEPHALLATLLWEVGAGSAPGGAPRGGLPRMLERSQFHTVRALELGPAPAQEAGLLFHLGTTCVQAGKLEAATKLFTRLLEDETLRGGQSPGSAEPARPGERPPTSWRARAQFWLGVVNYQMGRYKNAVLYLRQHLDHDPDNPKAHARLGMAYLQLGEIAKAREASNRALALDPADLQARWTLGCALAEEGRHDDATRALKSILEDAPDHVPAFEALVGLHRGNPGWLRSALRAEVKGFDRLPVAVEATRAHPSRPADPEGRRPDRPAARAPGSRFFPRSAVRRRIEIVLAALRGPPAEGLEPDDGAVVAAILEAMDLTTDEGLRFLLWENVLDHVSEARARELSARLASPGALFSARAGREVLALARSIPEELLVRGLQIDEEDLRRAAVDRHGPARDVADHRKAVDAERREARAWQALLLLSIASHGNRSSRNLLVRWAAEADPDLGDAARAALVMLGDEEATAVLGKRARVRGAQNLLDAMLAQVAAPSARPAVRALAPGEDRACTTCGRRPGDVAHMMVGGTDAAATGSSSPARPGVVVAVCDRCLAEIALHRRELETDDPEAVCALSGRGRFETSAMYVYQGLPISREVVDHGLGLLEREAVDHFLDHI